MKKERKFSLVSLDSFVPVFYCKQKSISWNSFELYVLQQCKLRTIYYNLQFTCAQDLYTQNRKSDLLKAFDYNSLT